jgi:hypothetical protein
MQILNFNSVHKPGGFFTQLSTFNQTEITHLERSRLMTGNNDFWQGDIENIEFKDGCEIELLSRTYFQEHIVTIPFHYTELWLNITLQIEKDKVYILTALERPYKDSTAYVNKMGLDLIDNLIKVSKPIINKFCEIAIIYISERFLKEVFSFVPNLTDNNWEYLYKLVKEKEFQELSSNSDIGVMLRTLFDNIGNKNNLNLKEREDTICNLSLECIHLLVGTNVSSWSASKKTELHRIILAEKQLTKNFKNPVLSLDELSKISGVNRQKFQKLFKEYYGVIKTKGKR